MVWLKLTHVFGTTAPPLKIYNPPLSSPASVPPAKASHVCDGFTLQKECAATCAQSYGAKSSATELTTQMWHFDGFTNADTALLLPICITTTLWQCSDNTVAQTEKFNALDCTNSTVGETRVGSCAIGYELASGASLGALTRVSKNESVACLTGSLPACQVTALLNQHTPRVHWSEQGW